MKNLFRHWRLIFLVSCLVYTGWMIHAGRNEFDRINGQYRRLNIQLEPTRIRAAALEALIADCQKILRERTGYHEDDCSAPEPQEIEARLSLIEEQSHRARQRGLVKLVLFYVGFVTIFLLAPMILVYLLITAVILLYKNIKIVR